MASRTGRTGDAGITPKPVAGPASHIETDLSLRPLLGYLRLPAVASDRDVENARRELAAFAGRDGFVLLWVFVDRSGLPTTGFSALFRALCAGTACHVVVPTLRHFAVVNGFRVVMKELLEAQTGARVLVVHPDCEESS
jgi:hypothetical protein